MESKDFKNVFLTLTERIVWKQTRTLLLHKGALFLKKVYDLFSIVVAFKTQRPPTPLGLFHCQNKTNKAVSRQIWYFFSVHTITEAEQSNGQGGARAGARAVDLPARSFDLARPGVAPPLVQSQDETKYQKAMVLQWTRAANSFYGDSACVGQ